MSKLDINENLGTHVEGQAVHSGITGEKLRTIAWDAWCAASMDEDNSARKCIDLVADAVSFSRALAAEDVIDAVLEIGRYAPKVIPMGANPPLFDGMQPDNDGPWLSRVDVAKRLRAALNIQEADL